MLKVQPNANAHPLPHWPNPSAITLRKSCRRQAAGTIVTYRAFRLR